MIPRSGFFVLDKQAGVSSARAISQLQRKLDIEKIGHAGTLDPFATGLLVVMVNRATRLASIVSGGAKQYRSVFRFGVATDSDDCTGNVLSLSPVIPDEGLVRSVLGNFIGPIEQKPPRISAVKIDGKRAYKRARSNEEFEIKARTVQIDEIAINRMLGSDVDLTVRCGSGTYIRSLARDLGERVGSCGTVMTLRRESSAPFTLEQARTVDEISAEDMIPWSQIFAGCERVSVSADEARALQGGDERAVAAIAQSRLPAKASAGARIVFELGPKGGSLGLFEYNGTRWKLWAYMGE